MSIEDATCSWTRGDQQNGPPLVRQSLPWSMYRAFEQPPVTSDLAVSVAEPHLRSLGSWMAGRSWEDVRITSPYHEER